MARGKRETKALEVRWRGFDLTPKLEAARRAIAECADFGGIRNMLLQANAHDAILRELGKQDAVARLAHRDWGEIRVRLHRRMGELLRDRTKAKPGRRENGSEPQPNTYAALGIDKTAASRAQKIASIPAGVFEQHILDIKDAGAEPTIESALRLATASSPLLSSENNEWYTPPEYVEVARATMGGIDLDPASTDFANETVRAKRFYSERENGLNKRWSGRVWLNPPYGRNDAHESNQAVWSARLIEAYCSGDISQAVLLVNAMTDTEWFRQLWRFAICFVAGRIAFIAGGAKRMSPTHPSALVYFGPEIEHFIEAAAAVGHIVLPSREAAVSRSVPLAESRSPSFMSSATISISSATARFGRSQKCGRNTARPRANFRRRRTHAPANGAPSAASVGPRDGCMDLFNQRRRRVRPRTP